eukprot:CAMPEP_0177684816 /NCGR_PEP_ID=MMETSP0447-20121125/32634_1 /TAXON_ID=0 /ORGANISM="Stygamoeba regulata, Strain BSH-02190019" /LENGTH=101 /DNA_ID=CAMNT_0019194691 /DNA_START=195 /DNA_END=496 /DNA_ORIENTATION=-
MQAPPPPTLKERSGSSNSAASSAGLSLDSRDAQNSFRFDFEGPSLSENSLTSYLRSVFGGGSTGNIPQLVAENPSLTGSLANPPVTGSIGSIGNIGSGSKG